MLKNEEGKHEDLKTREELIEACEKHFSELEIDYNQVITKFLKIKKDERQDDSHYLRKSARNQWNKEKQLRKEKKYDMYVGQKIQL